MRWVLPVLCLVMSCSSSPAQEKTNRNTKPKTAEASTDARENQSATTAKLPCGASCCTRMASAISKHLGRVRGSQEVHVDFTSAQLNDVLKSLTVLDLSGGRITGVDYNSEAPLGTKTGNAAVVAR